MEKYVVIRTDDTAMNVVSFEDDYGKACDIMTDNFFEYLRNNQMKDSFIEWICNFDGAENFLNCVGGNIDGTEGWLWMNYEVSFDHIGHEWKVIAVPFDEKKES